MLAYHVHLLVIDRGRFAGVRVMSRRVHRHKASGRGWPAAAHRAAHVSLIHGGQKREPVPSTEHEEIVNRASAVCGKSDTKRAGHAHRPSGLRQPARPVREARWKRWKALRNVQLQLCVGP